MSSILEENFGDALPMGSGIWIGPMFKYDNASMKLGMGDPCAGHKSVIATYWTCFVIEKESISEENLGFDPPTGTTM